MEITYGRLAIASSRLSWLKVSTSDNSLEELSGVENNGFTVEDLGCDMVE